MSNLCDIRKNRTVTRSHCSISSAETAHSSYLSFNQNLKNNMPNVAAPWRNPEVSHLLYSQSGPDRAYETF